MRRAENLNMKPKIDPTPKTETEEPLIAPVATSAKEALRERLSQTGFKSVWLVGNEQQHTHQL